MHNLQVSPGLGSYTELGVYFSTLLSVISPALGLSGALFLHSYSHKYGVLSVLVSCLSCLEMKWQEEKKNGDSSILFFSPGAVFLLPLLRAVIFLLWFLVVSLQQCGFLAGAGFSTGGRNERKSKCLLLTSSRSLLP